MPGVDEVLGIGALHPGLDLGLGWDAAVAFGSGVRLVAEDLRLRGVMFPL